MSPSRRCVLKSDIRFLFPTAGKWLRRRAAEALNEVVRRICIVRRGGAHTHLMSECVGVLRDRLQFLFRASFKATTGQRLRVQPADDPEVLYCLRNARTAGSGPSFVPGIRLADGSFSDDPLNIRTVFGGIISGLFS